MNLFKFELKQLFSSGINCWAVALFILAGFVSIALGIENYKTVKISQIKSEKVFEYERDQVKSRESLPEIGSLAYSAKIPTSWHLSAWSALFNGQSQAYLATVKVTALAFHGQIYSREIINPLQQKSGGFDLGFVLVYLLPVLIGVMCVTLLAEEREAGRWSLLKSLPGGGARLIWRRIAWRFVLIFSAQLVLLILSASLLRLVKEPMLAIILAWLLTYNLFWFLLSVLIISMAKNIVYSSLSFIGCWLLLAILVPGAVHLYLNAEFHTDEDLQASLHQRMAMNDSWDGDQQKQLDEFLALYPEYADTEPLDGKFHWKWYYAAQHLSDKSVESHWLAYLESNTSRAESLARLSWLSPSLMLQYRLNHLAGSDGASYLSYQQQVMDYHGQLREFFYPLLFSDVALTPEIIDAVPMFDNQQKSTDSQWSTLLIIFIVLTLIAVFARRRLDLLVYEN